MFMDEKVFLIFLSMLCLVTFDFLPHSLTLRRPSERTAVRFEHFWKYFGECEYKTKQIYIYKENKSTGF